MASRFQFSIRWILGLTASIAACVGLWVADNTWWLGIVVVATNLVLPPICWIVCLAVTGHARAFWLGVAFSTTIPVGAFFINLHLMSHGATVGGIHFQVVEGRVNGRDQFQRFFDELPRRAPHRTRAGTVTAIGAARGAFARVVAVIRAARGAFATDPFGLIRLCYRRKCFESLPLGREPVGVLGQELRPIAGKLHIFLRRS